MGNPLVGVIYHWLGGFASATFYVPYRGVKRWSWEIFWLTGGIFSWLVAPWFFAAVQTNEDLNTNIGVDRSATLPVPGTDNSIPRNSFDVTTSRRPSNLDLNLDGARDPASRIKSRLDLHKKSASGHGSPGMVLLSASVVAKATSLSVVDKFCSKNSSSLPFALEQFISLCRNISAPVQVRLTRKNDTRLIGRRHCKLNCSEPWFNACRTWSSPTSTNSRHASYTEDLDSAVSTS